MKYIVTASGIRFRVLWCGQSTIDNALRFEIVNSTMMNVLSVFMNPAETQKLTYIFDEHETVFDGFTQFKGIEQSAKGTITVALVEG